MTEASLPLQLPVETPTAEIVVPVLDKSKPLSVKEGPVKEGSLLDDFKVAAQAVLDHAKIMTGKDIKQLCDITTMPPDKAAPDDYVLVLTPRKQNRFSFDRLPASPFRYFLSFSGNGRVELATLFCDEAKRLHHAVDESLYVSTARQKSFGKLSWGKVTTANLDTQAIARCLVENMRADGVYAPLPKASL